MPVVELDPQALLIIGTHIVKKRCCILYDVRWTSMPVGLLFHKEWYVWTVDIGFIVTSEQLIFW